MKIKPRTGSIASWSAFTYQRLPPVAGDGTYKLTSARSIKIRACDRCGRERPVRPDRLHKNRADICRDCLISDKEYVKMVRDKEALNAQQASTEMAS